MSVEWEKLDSSYPTPEEKLRMKDTSGIKGGVHHCFVCNARYVPGSDDTGMCTECFGKRGVSTKAVREDKKSPNEETCLLCSKVFEVTPVVGTRDPICPECRATYKDTAVLRCHKCKGIICRIKPTVMECGFIVKPGMVLHSTSCNICNPSLSEEGSTIVIEVDEWIKNIRPRKTYMGR